MPLDDQELRAVQFLGERVRKATPGAGVWEAPGFAANLRKLSHWNLHLLIEHVMRHAADPKAKNPGVLLGAYTPPAPVDKPEPFRPPKASEACRVCGGWCPRGQCVRDQHAADGEQPAPPKRGPGIPAPDGFKTARDALRGAS